MIIPDTFFFVCIKVNEEEYSYGPYLALETAIEILVDIAPAIAATLAGSSGYSYESTIEERIIDYKKSENFWKTISKPLSEQKAYIKKTYRK